MRNNNIKHILKVLALIFLLCFIIDKVIFFTLNRISDKVFSGQSIGKVNHYIKIKDNKILLIFGSSRANHNIDPSVIDSSSFNMGVDGKNIAYSVPLIKMLENKTPQTLLVHIDPETLYSDTYDGKDIEALSIKYHRNKVIKDEIDKLHLDNPFQHFFWSISYNNSILGIVKNYVNKNYDYRNYNGYDPIDVDINQKKIFDKILLQKELIKCQDSFPLNTIFYNYLLELKKFSKNKTGFTKILDRKGENWSCFRWPSIFSHPAWDTAARCNFFVRFSRRLGISSAKNNR